MSKNNPGGHYSSPSIEISYTIALFASGYLQAIDWTPAMVFALRSYEGKIPLLEACPNPYPMNLRSRRDSSHYRGYIFLSTITRASYNN